MTPNRMLVLAVPLALVLGAGPDRSASGAPQKWYEKAVKKVEAKFDPAEAKPGQTVTVIITVELNDGYNTYPTAQPDKAAVGMVNSFKFPKDGPVIFVGPTADPKEFGTKAEPELGIKELRYLSGAVTFTRKAVVSPRAAAGPATTKLNLILLVCDKDACFPPKDVPLEAALKVLPGPAVPVEPEYADEVNKALSGKK
jgi:hypothetical protein